MHNVKVLPCPSMLRSVSVPPSKELYILQIESPRPVPFNEPRIVSGT